MTNKLGIENIDIIYQDSQKCKPIQVVDFIAGCLRRYLNNDDIENYNIICNLIDFFQKI